MSGAPARRGHEDLSGHRLVPERIERAAASIDPVFLDSPQFEAESLSRRLGCRLVVKVETVNPIRSFKGRGACCFVAGIDPGENLVCASAGNFGQAMAYACRLRGMPLVVYAAVNASPLKIERMQGLGAEVRLDGDDFDAAKDAARGFAAAAGARMVEDGLEPGISEGAGTMAVELLRGPWQLDTVVVPLGNGAMLGGVARWVAERSPSTEIVAVQATGAPAMARSWREGRIVEHAAATIADGIAVRVPIPAAVDDMRGLVDDVVLVDDELTIEAMRLCHAELGLVLEPAGAVGVAAIMAEPERWSGRTVATILCGGNVSREDFDRWFGQRAG